MLDQRFMRGEIWGETDAGVAHIETHAAHVFLVGSRAYKIKKDVKLPYLDFSTVEKRRAVLQDEYEINRRFTPSIYLGVEEKLGEPVLVMNRFDAKALLSWQVEHGGIGVDLARRLAAMVARSHELAPRRDTPGSQIMSGLGAQLSRAFTDSPDLFRAADTLEFHALYEDSLKRLKSLLNQRGEQGLVRRCHGDMHCGNIVLLNGEPALFDAIEFSEKIATIDVLYDLAFLIMDLLQHGEARAANVLLNRYLHLRRDLEDLSGLAALPLFLSTRAGVRALVSADLVHELKVEASLKLRGDALDYFRASLAYLKPPRQSLTCIGGLSGTGKSTLAAGLAPFIGGGAGALHVRSDVERKVLAGVPETAALPATQYAPEVSNRVYQAMFSRAEQALRAGCPVILDAVFAHESERDAAATLAQRTGAAFSGFWLEAGPAVLKARVLSRRGDPSDATPQVVDTQLGYDLGQVGWDRIDASGPPEASLAAVRRKLPPRLAGRA